MLKNDIKALEAKMKRMEYFHSLRVPDNAWIVVRLDGRGFTKLTGCLEKPFDDYFHEDMVYVTQRAFTEFQGIYAETHSDEISILFHQTYDLFDREVEKIVSTTAAFVSAVFTAASPSEPATFDSRIWFGCDIFDVADYFYWRQVDCLRGGLNTWAYWKLRESGSNAKEATRLLEGKDQAFKQDLLHEKFGINFNDIPLWQKRGTGIYWKRYVKDGHNPKTGESTKAVRRRAVVDEELPTKDNYWKFIQENLYHATAERQWTFTDEMLGKWWNKQ